MSKVLEHIKITSFTHCKSAMQVAATRILGEEVGMKKSNAKNKKKKKLLWKRRILRDISRLRKDLSRIEAWFWGKGQEQK